jgi:hypothetical protein
MTYDSELTIYGPMQPFVWEATAQPRSKGYVCFDGKGRTKVEATMAALSLMKDHVRSALSPQCNDWTINVLTQLQLGFDDPKWVEGHTEHGTFMYATISIGPLPHGPSDIL